MFSLIQTAIENGLDPYKYLTWLLKQAKDADLKDSQVIQSLLPWNAHPKCDPQVNIDAASETKHRGGIIYY